jgi:hypothetical protein
VTDLLSSKRMFLNQSLASVFGIAGTFGAELTATEVTAPERGFGILSQPGVLAAYSRPTRGDPIHRGLFVYYSLACGGQVPGPPAGALEVAKTFPPDATERELAGLRAANNVCKACHARFDPLGLATERYDAMGRYRERDASGNLIDQSAQIVNVADDIDGPIDGVGSMASKLLQGRHLSDCAATNLAVFTLGRDVKTDTSCAIRTVKNELARTGKFKDFYKALVTAPEFALRDVE